MRKFTKDGRTRKLKKVACWRTQASILSSIQLKVSFYTTSEPSTIEKTNKQRLQAGVGDK